MPKTSSKFGWGGARPNSGGARPNCGGPQPGSGRPRKSEPIVTVFRALGPRWYVLETQPQAERRAAVDLAREGYIAYLPMRSISRRDKVTPTLIHTIRVPIVPGYVFVELDLAGHWAPAVKCDGVRGILRGQNGRPGAATAEEMDRLRMEEAKRSKLADAPKPPHAVGAVVRIINGAFEGHTGSVVCCDGVETVVRIEFMGRDVEPSMQWGDLKAVA